MNILVTGGAGFIGVNTAVRFLQRGDHVTIVDNLSRKGTEFNLAFLEKKYPTCRFVRGDVRTDQKELKALMEEHDVVLHLAAQVAVTTSVVNPREDFEINALGTFNVLEAIRDSSNRPALLYASTNKVYGGLEHIPVTEDKARYRFKGSVQGVSEDCPLDFHSPYGCSKGAADQYVRDYARIYGLRTVVFRQSCIYGPHQLGVEDQGWVAWFLIAGLFARPVTVYGNGKQVRDLLYVDDLVDAYERTLDRIDTMSGQVINLGGGPGNTLSLLEFLEFMRTELSLPIKYSFGELRAGDQPIFVSDNTKMEKLAGWKPKVAVAEGIPKLLSWLRENSGMLEGFYS